MGNSKEPQEYINEDNEIVDAYQLKKIIQSGIEQCIYKKINIMREKFKKVININLLREQDFFSIVNKKIKLFITNNHVLDKDFLDKEKKLLY